MRRAITLALGRGSSAALALSLLASGGCGSSDDKSDAVSLSKSSLARDDAPSQSDVPALAAGNTGFAFDMFQQLAGEQEQAGKNLVFSPFSLSTALAMTYGAARGETASEIKQALHFELEQPALHQAFNAVDLALASRGQGAAGADGTPFRLHVSNALWAQVDTPPTPEFLDLLALHYGTGVFTTNFMKDPEASRLAINAQVNERTEQLIPELLKPSTIDELTRFVLTNTIYFNASWQNKFDVKATQPAAFTKLDGTSAQVPTMNKLFEQTASYVKGDGYQAVALPYASSELRLIAVLPDEGRYETAERAANAAWFADVYSKLVPANVQVALPKFSYRSAVSVQTLLQALGMNKAFVSGEADLSGLRRNLHISAVLHEAVIEVMEGGTIAAGATAVVINTRKAATPGAQTVRFDRPFLYAIVDQPTGHILFLGRVLDPSAS